MSALNSHMLYFMFQASNMHRWNDHLKIADFTELDKQAHKSAISWILGRSVEDSGEKVDWKKLVMINLYDLISRLVLTDIKPQLYHRMMDERSSEVNEYVLHQFLKNVPETSDELYNGLSLHLESDRTDIEYRISSAAHYVATKWEFDLIYPVNRAIYGIENTRKEIYDQVSAYSEVAGVNDIISGKGTNQLIDMIAQLRFQKRWSMTPRVPETTVLGHSLMVANGVLLNDLDKHRNGKHLYNDHFSALFHDLPEVLTKDVITPVKRSVSGLPSIIGDYEKEMVESRLMPLVPEGWREELRWMVYEPFTDSETRSGADIKVFDNLSAYMEALISIKYGTTSKILRDGVRESERKLLEHPGDIDVEGLVRGLQEMDV